MDKLSSFKQGNSTKARPIDPRPVIYDELELVVNKINSIIDLLSPLENSQFSTLKIGSSANYTEIEADGTIKFGGTATVFEDLNFDPTRSGGPAATRPGEVEINNVFYAEFDNGNNEKCGDIEECPHKAQLEQTWYPHLHAFLKPSESAGTTGVTFTIYWQLRTSTATTSGSVPLTITSAQLSANPHQIFVEDVVGFAGPTVLGGQIALALARTGGNAGDVIVTTYGVHYPIDAIGSRTISTK